MNSSVSLEKGSQLSAKDAQKLMQKWAKLRRTRIENEVNLLNYVYTYSYAAKILFFDFINSIGNNDFDNAISKLNHLNEWAENWLQGMWNGLKNTYKINDILSDNDWDLIQAVLLANSDNILTKLRELIESDESERRLIFFGALILMINVITQKESLTTIFREDSEKTSQLFEQYVNELGELTCRGLYGEICAELPRWGEVSIADQSIQNECEDLMTQLWIALKNDDIPQGLAVSSKLKRSGKKGALMYAQQISELQSSRIEIEEESEKRRILKEELEITKQMKQSGLYYAISLYFMGILRLAEKGYKKLAEEEFKEAKELPFDSPEQWEKVAIADLLENKDQYDGKIVKVEGFVTKLKEKKMRGGKGEVVFTILEIQSDNLSVELYFPMYWLSDNGLKKQGYGVFVGTFNKMCMQAKRPDIHLIRLNYSERKKNDWLSRCKWLIRDWWDGFTDRTPAEWTLSTLTPEGYSVSLSPPLKERSTEEYLVSMKKKFPSIRAALRSFKRIMSDPVLRNFTEDYLKAVLYHYDRNLKIDLLLYLTIAPFLKKPKKANVSRIHWSSESVPWLQNDSQAQNFICETETQRKNLGQNLDWLLFELEAGGGE